MEIEYQSFCTRTWKTNAAQEIQRYQAITESTR